MKQVTIYAANDGTRFDTAHGCIEYERLATDVDAAMLSLPPRPRLEHGRWIQHDRDACNAARIAMNGILRRLFGDMAVFTHNTDDKIMPFSIAGRFASESSPCVSSAYHRLSCINWDNFREYDQPYFAMHPSEAVSQ